MWEGAGREERGGERREEGEMCFGCVWKGGKGKRECLFYPPTQNPTQNLAASIIKISGAKPDKNPAVAQPKFAHITTFLRP